jgi:hypothetical protein
LHAVGLQERIEAVRVVRRDQLDVESEPLAARGVALDDGNVLRAPRNLEAARSSPVERLPRVLAEARELRARDLHELCHEIGRARMADEPGRAR